MTESLWLDPIPPGLRSRALEAFVARDACVFLSKASNDYGLDLVMMNKQALKNAGIYESALLHAFIGTRTNNRNRPLECLHCLFQEADRDLLLAEGDAVPPGEQFMLYRGVAGRGPARRVRGLSWTSNRERAEWFANRARGWNLHDPAVYAAEARRQDVYAYVNERGRGEEEFIVLLPAEAKVRRLERATT